MIRKKIKKRLGIFAALALILMLIFYFSLPSQLFPHHQYSTVIVDKYGQLLSASISPDEQWHFQRKSPISQKYLDALIQFEDKRFLRHIGVDFLALSRAIVDNVKQARIVSGASTLTMQTIRLHRNNPSRTIVEKIREMFLAIRLDASYSKAKILDLYAGHAPFGGNVIGIDAATWRYFGKSAENLSWAEAALLAVLPNSPGLIHTEKNREILKIKRDLLLQKLYEKELIDQQTYKLGILEPIPRRTKKLKNSAPHLLQSLRSEKGESYYETTIDPILQSKCLEIAAIEGSKLKENNIDNLAMLILDIETNEVLAYIGNLQETGMDQQEFVDIIQSPRSSGSVLKPFLYAAALDESLIEEKTLLPDYPILMDGFVAENYQKKHDGLVPANKALMRSLNIPFSFLLQQYGIEKFRLDCQELGLKTINKTADHYGIPLILGGAEITLWDITNAYGFLGKTMNTAEENNGYYSKSDLQAANLLAKARKRKKELVKQATVFSRSSIWKTLESIRQVVRPNEQGEWRQFSSSHEIAWKTGTSNGFKDAWAVGVNSKYAIGVWVGNADGEGRPGIVGSKAAAPIFFRLLNILGEHKWFSAPIDDFKKAAMCATSGSYASDFCPIDTQYVSLNKKSRSVCPYHEQIWLDEYSSYRVASQCYDMRKAKPVSHFAIPEKVAYYYRQQAQYSAEPPYHPDCSKLNRKGKLKIIYPEARMKIYLPELGEGNKSRLIFRAHHTEDSAKINWHLDQNFVGTTEDIHEINSKLNPGQHQLTIVDQDGFEDSVFFEVVQ